MMADDKVHNFVKQQDASIMCCWCGLGTGTPGCRLPSTAAAAFDDKFADKLADKLVKAIAAAQQANAVNRIPVYFGRFVSQRFLGWCDDGVVLAARDKQTNEDVVMKVVRSKSLGDLQITTEHTILTKYLIDVVGVPKFIFFGVCDKNGAIVTLHSEVFCKVLVTQPLGTPLDRFVCNVPPAQINDALSRLLLNLASIVRRIHECGIMHGDIIPSNVIVLDDEQSVVLIDFGVASKTCAKSDFDSDVVDLCHCIVSLQTGKSRSELESLTLAQCKQQSTIASQVLAYFDNKPGTA